MELSYKTRIVNRWFGAPCEDQADELGLLWFAPFTIEKAREAVAVMGYTPKNDDVNDELETFTSDGEIQAISIEIEPTRAGADSAWIEIWKGCPV